MKLRSLLSGCGLRSAVGNPDIDILGVAYDSRRVAPGFVFVAMAGSRADGNRFVSQAIDRGAVAVISAGAAPEGLPQSVCWTEVADDRGALATVAANYFGHPTRSMHLVGVTGTNGKTTTTYLIEAILRAAGKPAAVFGTIAYRGPGFDFEAERTTPEASDLEQLFRRVADAGWKYSVMEVSSHAIELKRVASLHFEVAAFTNLSREHLDFHGGMREYFLAKRKLFEGMAGGAPRAMVLNADDAHFEELRTIAPERATCYGMGAAADIYPSSHRFGWEGTEAVFVTPLGAIDVRTPLLGTPNLYNIGAAIGVASALGISAEAIRVGLEMIPSVPGRFEPVHAGQSFRVIVDYAHTGEALQKVLAFAREVTVGALTVVFGCGGDRDRTKRPVMGEAAVNTADRVIVTSDNPRSEDPLAIIREVVGGLKASAYEIEPDRKKAIRLALMGAKTGDTVVIAGKGHETYQLIGTQVLPFDDRAVAREILNELTAGRNS